ncbi:MAG: endonuclease III domain-containing protein [Candidatus Omnitrophica bacterium]|nr:endonuclease III domain-containing protein [Candidatus Omnitrophota bacterium]
MKPSKSLNYPAKRYLKSKDLLAVYKTLRKSFGHQKWWPARTPFEMMVGAILTQNTAWINVEKAIENLRSANALSFAAIRRISERRLAALIRPAGYFNIKANRLKHLAAFLQKEFQGNFKAMFRMNGKKLRERLLQVKGIGPETADSILLYGAKKYFFVIDAYTKRIFTRHRLIRGKHSYDVWQKLFNNALPRKLDLFNDFHAQIVAVGKHFCRSTPQCESCPLKIYL